MIRTGIYGGSFNPIHRGHVALARSILKQAHLDEVWFLVSPQNPFKQGDNTLLDDDKRLLLATVALRHWPRLVASDYEFSLPKPSYTYITLRSLAQNYPDREFHLIIGADNWVAFPRWKNAQEIIQHYPIIVYPRKDCPIDATTLPPTVHLVDAPLYDISSTEIRQRLAEGKSVSHLVPSPIKELVKQFYPTPATKAPSLSPQKPTPTTPR